MSLTKAFAHLNDALEAYRALLQDNPDDYEEAARRQQQAADFLDKAQSEGFAERGNEDFMKEFRRVNAQIEVMEAKRVSGGYDEDEPDGEDDEEPTGDEAPVESSGDYESSRAYSSMAEPVDAE